MIHRLLARSLPLLSIVAFCAVLAGVGPVAAADKNVSIVDLAYRPNKVTINQGEVVTWKNDGARSHTVTADDGSFDSGTLSPGDAFANLFEKPGTYAYHCTIHPTRMKGVVTVKAVAARPISSDVTPPPGTAPPGLITPSATPAPQNTTNRDSPILPPLADLVVLSGIGLIAYLARRRR
jgi:plastocyanin